MAKRSSAPSSAVEVNFSRTLTEFNVSLSKEIIQVDKGSWVSKILARGLAGFFHEECGFGAIMGELERVYSASRTSGGNRDAVQKAIRAHLSKVIDTTGNVFENIAKKRGLDFKCEKRNADYVEFGGGNKMCTLKIWYQSQILNRRSFMKVQTNFVENMCFPSKKGQLSGLLTGKHEELEALFPEYAEYATKIPFGIYDIREILSEKVRALLTREGTKARDFLDVYLIYKRFGIKLYDMERCIVNKTNFALKLYDKYRSNLKEKISLIGSGKLFEWGEERDLLLAEIDEGEFYSFLDEFQKFLKKIISSLGNAVYE